ncbi:unnamed protein product [Tetraodon nigroviridis]|uniref:(spotted green pufferfish) hypothetical protein n=1 Tax=Tetraodon nigroviridis TaxID=99883 RepID=Q4SUI8_TETNG|nr:unnamed protein product [Tetraodon nigroviridis]
MVVLMDTQGIARLNWPEFQALWDKIRKWTDIFLVFDKNKSKRLEYQEVGPSLKAAGIVVDDLIMQLVGLRYTEPDMTISYPGFLYLLLKLENMICDQVPSIRHGWDGIRNCDLQAVAPHDHVQLISFHDRNTFRFLDFKCHFISIILLRNRLPSDAYC